MKNLTFRLGARIKALRKSRGFSQEQLAEKSEITPKYLSRLEVGQQSPSIETLGKLAEALNVELWELCDFGHEGTHKELQETLRKIIHESDEKKLRVAVKVFRAVTR
jgi:transcriptional regulator with XRE-family HTH domain